MMKLFRNNLAEIGTPTVSDITKNSMKVAGSVTFYKDGTWGVAYKKDSASTWTHKASTSQSISETLSSPTASTKYNIKLYVLFGGVYQYGPSVDKTTSAA